MLKSRYFIYLLICVTGTLLFACKPELVSRPDQTFKEINGWLDDQKSNITYGLPGQAINTDTAFKQGYLLIYGEGLPKKGAETAGQRRLTAQRAAEVIAQRNLAHVLSQGGAYGSVRFDNYSAQLKTALKGFQFVSKEYNDEVGKAAVLIRYDLKGANRFVR